MSPSKVLIIECISDRNNVDYRGSLLILSGVVRPTLYQLNASKTKEMVIDFRRMSSATVPVNIQGKDIETMISYM